jgi:hypothetical protein
MRPVPVQVVSKTWEDRYRILEENVNLYCWRRQSEPVITEYLQKISTRQPDPVKQEITLDHLPYELSNCRKGWESEEDGDEFWADVSRITWDFLHFSKKGRGVLHLRVVDHDACTKFHIDGYSLRLFTTYLGPGTEWLPESAVNRTALKQHKNEVIKDPSQIMRMSSFEVGILKGEPRGSVNNMPGIVHRSPQISHLHKKRIILRIDI